MFTDEWYIMMLGRMLLKLQTLDDSRKATFFNVKDYQVKFLTRLLSDKSKWLSKHSKDRNHVRKLVKCFSHDETMVDLSRLTTVQMWESLGVEY